LVGRPELNQLTNKAACFVWLRFAAGVCCPVLSCLPYTEGLVVVVELCHLWLGSRRHHSLACPDRHRIDASSSPVRSAARPAVNMPCHAMMPASGTVVRARIDQVPLPCLNAQSLPQLRRAHLMTRDDGSPWPHVGGAVGFATCVCLPGYEYSQNITF